MTVPASLSRPWYGRPFIWLAGLLVAGGVVLALPIEETAPTEITESRTTTPMRVTVVTADRFDFSRRLHLSGLLAAREDISISTAVVGQRIAEVLVEVGDTVTKGQLLARLKSDLLVTQVSRAEAIRTAFQNDNSGRDISIILAGDDGTLLSATVARLEAEMRAIPGLANVQSDEPLPRPEVRITPRFAEAARAGVSTLAIGKLARIATEGETDGNSAKFNLGDRLIPIRVKLAAEAQGNLDTLAMLRVATDQGSTVPLIAVADIEVAEGTGFLNRFDRQRRITLNADLDGIPLGDALATIAALPTMTGLPAGVREVRYGEAAYIDEMYASFGTAMAFGVLVVFAVLIVLFRSFLQPITILVSLPLSIGGAIGGLLLYGGALDLPSVIGLLMLMGIVTKNSILLVEFAIEKLREGMDRRTALIASGVERARPIIMTTLAMIAGMVPAAIGVGGDAGFRAPMAIAVIGGLVTSTLLSLVFVPVVFSYMDDLSAWLSRVLSRLTSVTDADQAAAERALLVGQPLQDRTVP